eukprot:SAG22_NODE_3215_length_1852_cov_1.387336_3_plen_57_part_00
MARVCQCGDGDGDDDAEVPPSGAGGRALVTMAAAVRPGDIVKDGGRPPGGARQRLP